MQQMSDFTADFHEEQRFTQPWIWILLLVMTAWVAGMFVHGLYTQLYLGQPWGDRPMSDSGLIISATITLLITAGLLLLFYKLKLVTKVDSEGLHIRFFPLTNRTIAFTDITSCKVRDYRPIREYGGWGIRFSRKGRAYNVSGNRGVQLELSAGRPVLVGSQKPEALANAINNYL